MEEGMSDYARKVGRKSTEKLDVVRKEQLAIELTVELQVKGKKQWEEAMHVPCGPAASGQGASGTSHANAKRALFHRRVRQHRRWMTLESPSPLAFTIDDIKTGRMEGTACE